MAAFAKYILRHVHEYSFHGQGLRSSGGEVLFLTGKQSKISKILEFKKNVRKEKAGKSKIRI